MSLFRTEGIILRSRNFGEADKIVVIFTKDKGKIEAVAKGARRPRSRLVGAAQPFSYLKLLLFTGKNLHQLSQAEIIRSFGPLRDDLMRMAYAAYWTELVDAFLPLDEPNLEIFLFLLAGLIVLEKSSNPTNISRAFEIRLLSLLGYLPSLENCAHCGSMIISEKRPETIAGFSPEEGGVICTDCFNIIAVKPVPLSIQGLGLLKELLNSDLRKVNTWNIPPTIDIEISRALQLFIEYRTEKPLKSLSFLQSIQV